MYGQRLRMFRAKILLAVHNASDAADRVVSNFHILPCV